jgi:hypothetical protein
MLLTIAQAAGAFRLVAVTLMMLAGWWSSVAWAQPASAPILVDDPFARRGWHVELGGHAALEAWNYNLSHEELFGFVTGMTYGLRDGLVFTASWPFYHVSQRGPAAFMMGATFGVRGRLYRRPSWSIFLGGALGIADADTFVPSRGTRFNYLAIGSVGMTKRISRGVHWVASLDVTHVSNGGHAGRSRNPDIEAIGPRVGVVLAF